MAIPPFLSLLSQHGSVAMRNFGMAPCCVKGSEASASEPGGPAIASHRRNYDRTAALVTKTEVLLKRVPPAEADAFHVIAENGRQGLWKVKGLGEAPVPLFAAAGDREAKFSPEDLEP